MSKDTWTAARVAELTQLWADGFSGGAIAKKMNLSKNAIVGKAHRLGLPSRPSPIIWDGRKTTGARGTRSQRQARLEAETPAPTIEPINEPAPEAPPRDETKGLCQYIEGEPSADDACKCNAPALRGRPYCLDHARKAYRYGSPSQSRKLTDEELRTPGLVETSFKGRAA